MTRFFVNTTANPVTVEIAPGFSSHLPPGVTVEIDDDLAAALEQHPAFEEIERG